jgi:threonine/homoserine/homoserine lactone efflux protein
MSLEIYLAYVLACVLITIIPGPTVTVIVGNSLVHGTRAGLLNVAGTQAGLALMMLTLIVGLSSDPKGNYVAQIALLGVTAMATAALTDGAYAVLTGRAGAFFSRSRIRLVSRLSGGFLIGGGLWLALTRAK